jgi:hypothetical protein
MSYNGSGTFNINSAGQPVVAGTVISATAFNALTADLGVGLSTAITKDGQTTTTARITFAQGVTSSLTTDSSSTSTGSIITAGGVGIAKALFVGTTANITGAVTLSSLTSGRVTYASTGGLLVDSANLTFNGTTLTAAGLAGPHNGTVGATTPATGAFTTVSATGTITSTKSGYVLQRIGVDTGYQAINLGNTGADCYLGAERSTGSGILNGSTGYALVLSNGSNVPVQIGSNNVVVATFKQGGSLALENATTSTGCGISFPATQSASSDANTLDDYEEGTWTPSIGGTATYGGGQFGRYTKIGRSVTLLCVVEIGTIGTGSTQTMSGLPFPLVSGAQNPLAVAYFTSAATSVVFLAAYINSNASTVSFAGLTAASTTSTAPLSVFGNSTRIDIAGSYTTN